MSSRFRHTLAGLVVFGISACSPYAPAQRTENDLALSGFVAHPADTTARWQMMNLLPPNHLAYRMSSAGPILLYADPLACGCVYFGDRQAYQSYTAQHRQTPLQEKQMTAEINQHPGWDWSVWAPTADPAAVEARRGY
ncbi:hypothetical protein AA101099_1018 [Neoasaia chiangmaiensis NBRC 101099]|nr:hypothetical protein [Neoasaia chiangmaiensis]GBR38073.1 hypothetical protein AA101099_1018 [Neoasaia chiangmaiensis NBRC 101099]GEN16066.1 hypothetical protein NCH01_24970 [Neoasaia chiangmaiensis]